jgi:hypothetical protein
MAIERLRGTLRTFDRALNLEEQDSDSAAAIEPLVDDEPMTGPPR